MTFSTFAKAVYPHLSGLSNQGWFIGELFHAAGSTFFTKHPSYGADDYHVKVYNGSKPFNKKMKASFPKPIPRDALKEFFEHRIGTDTLSKMMVDFGISAGTTQNKELFVETLCIQFENIVTEVSDETEDIVAKTYLDLLAGIQIEAKPVPLYPGDDYEVLGENPAQYPDVGFYKEFTHTWIIKNSGTTTWNGRHLEIINQHEVKPEAKTPQVDIPSTKPGEEAVITVTFDSRGDERGLNESIWQIKNSDGQICFPNKGGLRLIIKVYNDLDD